MRARSNRCRASTTTLVPREASRVAVVDGWHLIVVEHICVDVNPETVETGTGHDTEGSINTRSKTVFCGRSEAGS